MKTVSSPLQKLGFDDWFQDNGGSVSLEAFEPARVIAVHKDSYTINNGQNDFFAELTGKILYSATSPVELPAVGDWVFANLDEENSFSIIHGIMQRKSVLKRKIPGKKIDFQLIAANIDVAFIVQSLDGNFNLRRLERYLVMIHESKIRPIVLLSKSDLLSSEQVSSKIGEIKKIMPQLPVQPFSNKSESSLTGVKGLLNPGLTYCLLGSSGVGKTTLLNNLIGESIFKTKTVREKDRKGRHATTRRQLISLDSGAMVVDTPGMRELGNISVDTGLDGAFAEITGLKANCRFADCTHVNEKGCAVLKALADGRIPEKRYQNFIKLYKESIYNQLSYYEKRKKDKAFGKLVKSVMKHKKNRR
jgi:ribosome biogenesis GTPase